MLPERRERRKEGFFVSWIGGGGRQIGGRDRFDSIKNEYPAPDGGCQRHVRPFIGSSSHPWTQEGGVINGRSLVFSRFAKVDKIKFQLLKYYFSPSLKNKNCSLASNQVLKTEKSAAKLQRRGRTTSAS